MKILVADDDPIIVKGVSENLSQWGYEVITADNGIMAWGILQRPQGPKLALLDWQMPGMTGVEICSKIREQHSGSYIYMVILTGLGDKTNIIQGLEAGADDYLVKPCNAHELRLRLQIGQRILSMELELLSAFSQIKSAVFPRESMMFGDVELTEREKEVLRLISLGKSNEEISRVFHSGTDLIRAHVSNIMLKLNVQTREELVVIGQKEGFYKV